MLEDQQEETFHHDIVNVPTLERCLRQTLARVNETKLPVYVAIKGQPGVAMVDMDEYRELRRLAEIGFAVEAHEEIERNIAEGTVISWDELSKEWEADIERWKREELG